MCAADMRKRVERLKALLAGFYGEADAVRDSRGELTITEWNQYQRALDCTLFGLRGCESILQRAADRIEGKQRR